MYILVWKVYFTNIAFTYLEYVDEAYYLELRSIQSRIRTIH